MLTKLKDSHLCYGRRVFLALTVRNGPMEFSYKFLLYTLVTLTLI